MTFSLTEPGTDVPLVERAAQLVGAGATFGQVGEGIWDLIRPERRPVLDRFAADYAAVRAAESRELSAAQVQTLPLIDDNHPLAGMWRERAASHARFKSTIRAVPAGSALDIGAGCGWLAADLARSGWCAAAVDVTVDGGDGLAAARYHNAELLLARAEMQALPFASNSVDLAVFNASLHYAADVSDALVEAARVVRPGGSVVVLDSPVFSDPAAGRSMVDEFVVHSETTLGLRAAQHEGKGFVTEDDLLGHGLAPVHADGRLRRRVHQWRGARKAGRETATRPLLVATIGDLS